MNDQPLSQAAQPRVEAVQARFALRLAAALTEHQAQFVHADVSARLRFAHDQALVAARQARSVAPTTASAPAVIGVAGGSALLGGGDAAWWLRLSSLLPLAVLVAGLFLIDRHYTRTQIEAATEVDAAILADELPTEAYRDKGFVEFLKTAGP